MVAFTIIHFQPDANIIVGT